MDKTEALLKRYYASKAPELSKGIRPTDVPDAATLHAFLEDRLSGSALSKMLEALRADAELQELVLELRRLRGLEGESERVSVPGGALERARALGAGLSRRKLAPKRSYWGVWLALSIACFALSFWLAPYFIQWTAAGVLFGVKAIVDQRAAKTQVLIYKALEESEKSHLQRPSSRL